MKKKIIYIVGCGRSGSTLLGFALGNAVGALDLGEVIEFARFQGKPNGFGAETENYKYWQNILLGIEAELGPLDFESIRRMQMEVDSHASFLPVLLSGDHYPRKSYVPYQKYVKTLYEAILKDERHDVFVVGSKYPSRLLHLRRIFSDRGIHVIHLIRNPVDLVQAFQNKEQGKTKSFWQTMLYYFVINIFSILASQGLGKGRYLRVHYEDLIAAPENELTRIGSAFDIDTAPAIEKIRKGLPLERGYVFNGNRMRMNDRVVFRKRSLKMERRKLVERLFEGLSSLMFGGTSAKNINNQKN